MRPSAAFREPFIRRHLETYDHREIGIQEESSVVDPGQIGGVAVALTLNTGSRREDAGFLFLHTQLARWKE